MGFKSAVKGFIRETRQKQIVPIAHPVGAAELLEGKVAFIAGGNGGLGFAIANSLFESGCSVVIGGTNDKKSQKCLDALKSDRVKAVHFDVADCGSIEDQFSRAVSAFGKIDIFINSAGVHTENVDMWTMTPDEFERVMKINLEGAYFSSVAAARYMKENNIRGNILLISSTRGLEPAWSPYGISKWGINGMVKGLAQQLAPEGIKVNAIAPGSTATALLHYQEGQSINSDENKEGRLVMPDEVANLAKFLVSNCGNMITGEVISIGAGRGTFDIR